MDDELRKQISDVNRTLATDVADSYMTLDEAAAHARCSTRTLRRWIKTGKLPSIKSGRLLVDRQDLDDALRGIPLETP